MKKLFLIITLIFLAMALCGADTLYAKNGERISGIIGVSQSGTFAVIGHHNQIIVFPEEAIVCIERNGQKYPPRQFKSKNLRIFNYGYLAQFRV